MDQCYVSVPGASLYAQWRGKPDSPTVVLMGSLASDATSWEQQGEALARAGFRALTFDFRGHGRSTHTPQSLTLDLFVEDLRAVMHRCGVRRPHLLGLSLGGMVALHAASLPSADYRKIVIASTRADMPEPLASAWEARAREVRLQGVEAIAQGTIERWFTDSFRRNHPAAIDRVRAMIHRTDRAAYADCIEIVRTVDLMSRLQEIRSPVLYLTGEEDTASPPELMQAMQQRTPGARFATISSAAHLPNIEQSEAFNRLVIDFLES